QGDAVGHGGKAAAKPDPRCGHAGLEQRFDGRDPFADVERGTVAGGAEQHDAVEALFEEIECMARQLGMIRAALSRQRRRRGGPETSNWPGHDISLCWSRRIGESLSCCFLDYLVSYIQDGLNLL